MHVNHGDTSLIPQGWEALPFPHTLPVWAVQPWLSYLTSLGLSFFTPRLPSLLSPLPLTGAPGIPQLYPHSMEGETEAWG